MEYIKWHIHYKKLTISIKRRFLAIRNIVVMTYRLFNNKK